MANIFNPRKSSDRFASLPDVPPVCVSRNKQSQLPWDAISFIGSGIRQTLGSRASHNRRTSFGTVASQMRALCRLSDTVMTASRTLTRRTTALDKERQSSGSI